MIRDSYKEYQRKLIENIQDKFLGLTVEEAQLRNHDYRIVLSGNPMTYEYDEKRIVVTLEYGKITSIDSVG